MNKSKQYANYLSTFGKVKIGYKDKAITSLNIIKDNDCVDEGVRSKLSDIAFAQVQEYFEGKRKEFDFPYELNGTEFQKSVWKLLCDIPYGETRSYKEIAIAVGNPKASRAVGMANNKNPIAIVVPCHRVIGVNGKLVGYAGGLDMKTKLLKIESKD